MKLIRALSKRQRRLKELIRLNVTFVISVSFDRNDRTKEYLDWSLLV